VTVKKPSPYAMLITSAFVMPTPLYVRTGTPHVPLSCVPPKIMYGSWSSTSMS
jgi:hypothetical protein